MSRSKVAVLTYEFLTLYACFTRNYAWNCSAQAEHLSPNGHCKSPMSTTQRVDVLLRQYAEIHDGQLMPRCVHLQAISDALQDLAWWL